jgi:gliding motility-associated-like protein
MKTMKNYLFCLIFIVSVLFHHKVLSQGVVCPTVNAQIGTGPSTNICTGQCANLSASVSAIVAQTTTYNVASIPYFSFPYVGGALGVSNIDDGFGPVIPLPFSFCYWGTSYNQFVVSSNGYINFDISNAMGFSNWSITTSFPNVVDLPSGGNICGPFRDDVVDAVNYAHWYVTGVTPCRAMVVYWDNTPFPVGCVGQSEKFQIVLYESTNIIDVLIQSSPNCPGWNNGAGIVGIENVNGVNGVVAPGRNYPGTWVGANEAWRFTPSGASTFSWSWSGPGGVVGTSSSVVVCPTVNTTYTASCLMGCNGPTAYQGTVQVNLSPCNLTVNNSTICAGSNATIMGNNAGSLGNPSYSINPGGLTSPNPTFVVSPTLTTNYTVYLTGVNNQSVVVTQTAISTVVVNPQPIVAPTFTQASCQNSVNAVNLNLNFIPAAPVPNYTVNWNPLPPGPPTPTQTSVNNLAPGITIVTVTASGGCSTQVSFTMGPVPPPVSFTVNNLTGSYSITCTNPAINLQAVSNYTFGSLSYTWASPSFTANTSTVAITAPNNLTVTGTDLATGCQYQQTVAIGINTTVPTSSVNPTSQAITCATVAPVTFSGTISNPSVNIQMDWYSPLNPLPAGVPIATSNNTISILSGVIPPGVYTLVATNLVNGCKALKTVTVTSFDAWPTFGINSATNYSVGCVPLNQTTLSIINPVSTQTPPATCSYTFLPPGFAGAVPNGNLGVNTSTTIMLPGTWTVIVNDNSNNCRTILTVPIIQNTVAPNVSIAILTQTLTCNNPTLLATGTSSTPNSVISWDKPIAPTNVPSSTIIVGPGTGPNTSSTSLTYANYTVSATNTINACITTSVIVISQNFKKPTSAPNLSSGTSLGIYCNVNLNPVILNTGASGPGSGVPNAFAANPCWAGPSPQTPTCGPSSYSCYVAGIYSLTISDSYNGCTATGTINVSDQTQPPVISNTLTNATLDCGSGSATLLFDLTGTNTGVRYFIKLYPQGAAFSPTSATAVNGTSSGSVSVSLTGTYIYIVTNTVTGCAAGGTYLVKKGDLTADIDASPTAGYAPMTVSFNNLSSSSSTASGTSSITSIWSFGNGATTTNTNNESTSATYNAPGTYTVTLLVSKGICLDTAFKTIKVDIPSNLEVPNVFTPNGDGSNDVFFLKTANLTDVNAVIFDRWGNLVYSVDSSSGNIAWDGKSPGGKDCAPGVYFYIINATGKDAKSYVQKGNVSLYR